jgi:hypothetical protein
MAYENVISDAAGSLVAVVRPRRLRRMPAWVGERGALVVVGGDGVSGLTIRPMTGVRRQRWRVLLQGSALIGIIEPAFPAWVLTFRDCMCGQGP